MAVSRAPAPDSARQRMVWLFPLVFCLGSGSEVSRSSPDLRLVNGILGESAVLPLELPAGKMASVIVWGYEGEASHTTAILIIHLNESEKPQIIKADRKREKRLDITQSYSLQLSNLTMADAGSYAAQITTEDSEPIIFKYTLSVFERLSSLEVANHTLLLDNGTCEMHLACLVKNPNRTISVEWQAAGNNISLGEPNVTISWDPRNSSDQTYICRAENAVSNLSVSVSTQSLCKGILTNIHWNTVWLVITILLSMILILIFVCVALYVWKRRRGKFFFCFLLSSVRLQLFRVWGLWLPRVEGGWTLWVNWSTGMAPSGWPGFC